MFKFPVEFDREIFFGSPLSKYQTAVVRMYIEEMFVLMSGLQQPLMSTDVVSDEYEKFTMDYNARLEYLRNQVGIALSIIKKEE